MSFDLRTMYSSFFYIFMCVGTFPPCCGMCGGAAMAADDTICMRCIVLSPYVPYCVKQANIPFIWDPPLWDILGSASFFSITKGYSVLLLCARLRLTTGLGQPSLPPMKPNPDGQADERHQPKLTRLPPCHARRHSGNKNLPNQLGLLSSTCVC